MGREGTGPEYIFPRADHFRGSNIEKHAIFIIDDAEGVIERLPSAVVEHNLQELATGDGTHPLACFCGCIIMAPTISSRMTVTVTGR